METANKWTYLRVTMRTNNNNDRHMTQMKTKAIEVLKQMWSSKDRKLERLQN